tara:strand:- start:223 stop:429 length:207 start_codon:yes stop_codon:yes gene_type:complete
LILDLNNCIARKLDPGIDKNFEVDLLRLDFTKDKKSLSERSPRRTLFTSSSLYGSIRITVLTIKFNYG